LHPAAVGALASAGIPVPSMHPRGWDELARASSHRADFVITLDEATLAFQPSWPGQPAAALWAFPDAAALVRPEEAAHAAIQMLYALRRRLELMISLPLHGADAAAMRSDVRDLAHLQ
jgi:arsenate reductase